MDKFGIFKLLNNFFTSFDGTNNQTNFNGGADVISSLLKNITNNNSPTQEKKDGSSSSTPNAQPASKNQPQTQRPLQAQMISTIHSHEQFVKRVKEKNSR